MARGPRLPSWKLGGVDGVTLESVAEAKESFETAIRGVDVTGVAPGHLPVSNPTVEDIRSFLLTCQAFGECLRVTVTILLETWNRGYD